MQKRICKGESGQALVEFALVLPVFLLLLCGIIEFGALFSAQLTIYNNCREGARYASIHSDEADLTTTILNTVCIKPLTSDNAVQVAFSAENSQKYVTVTVSTDVPALTPVGFLLFSENHMMLTTDLTMRVEEGATS